ncbi:hypothetical protein O181_055697 [Austropuccinia psidii MF-1]|uniref:Uncharacterized protein n=1 Tax=Austropuccinia psidii MF-1 TaxID=1389203 RepID=A0A9Q3HTR0_9BASI|nr:hypothetical protein [Austropuccinia psidii MF-1]
MPIHHTPSAKNTRSQRHQAVLTPTARALLDRTPSVHKLSANLDRGPPMARAEPSRRGGVNLQELMEITLKFDNRYHERKNEKVSHQEKKPPIIGSDSSKPPQGSSLKRPYHRKNKKGKNFQVSKDKPNVALLNTYNKLIGYEK